MGPGTLALAFALSLAPAVLALLESGLPADGPSSLLALALLPWIALAGLPRARPGSPAVLVLAAALPALALAAALDQRAGLGTQRLVGTLASGVLLLSILAHGAARGRGPAYGILWCAAVPGLAGLDLVWTLVAGAQPLALLGASPIAWTLAAARGSSSPVAALCTVSILLVVALARPRPDAAGEEAA